MAAPADASFREYRRQQILAKKEERLQKIRNLSKAEFGSKLVDGVPPGDRTNTDSLTSTECLGSHTSIRQCSDQGEHVPVTSRHLQNQSSTESPKKIFPILPTEDQTTTPDGKSSLGSSMPCEDQVSTGFLQPLISSIVSTRLHLIILAMLVRFLYSTNHGYLFGESVFVPLFTVQLMKLCGKYVFSTYTISSTIQTITLLCGFLPVRFSPQMSSKSFDRAVIFLCILSEVPAILKDTYVYLFVFIIFHTFLENL